MKPEVQWKKPIPFIVNGRVHSYITDPVDDKIMMRVAMRRYLTSDSNVIAWGWSPEYVDLCFSRKTKTWGLAPGFGPDGGLCTETYYEVENPHIRFDDADKLSATPVITA